MSINLVSLIAQNLTPDMIARITSALGLNQGLVQKAITAAVPSLLAGFAGMASKPEGAAKLAQAIGEQPKGALDSLLGALGGSGQAAVLQQGSSMLTSLLGGSASTALVGAVAKYSGLEQGASQSLLGALAPVVTNVLGSQQTSAGGLATLLASQKDNIASALPSGFGDLLKGSGLLDSLGGTMQAAGAAAGASAAAAAATAQRAATQTAAAAQSASGMPSWLKPALIAAAVVVAGWFLFGRSSEPVQQAQKATQQVTQQAQQATSSAAGQLAGAFDKLKGLAVGGVDVGNQVSSALDGLRTSLDGIKDGASAQAALPKLQDATGQIDKVTKVVADLPPDARKLLAAAVTSARPTIDSLIDKVMAIPGVSAVIKPTVDTVRAELDQLAKT